MKKLTFSFLFLIVALLGFGQKIVKIEFYKNSTGDYDLMIKNVLNKNGFNAFVNYGNNNTKADYILEYTTVSREKYDELHKFIFILYDNKKNVISKFEKTISYMNFGVNEPKVICKGLEKLFNKKFGCKFNKEKNEVNYFNINFNVHKIDSCTYSIIAKGAGIRPLEDVKKAFLRKAGQYLDSFEYYFENGDYNYKSRSGSYTFNHSGYSVWGIIKHTQNESPKKLGEKPIEFITEFEK